MKSRTAVLIVLAVAGGASAQKPTPPSEHVTAPSLPGQANKEIVVKPSGTLRTTRDGLVVQGPRRTVSPPLVVIRPREGASAAQESDSSFETLEPPPGPTGAPVVGAAFVSRRGTLVKHEKGSVTILETNGRERTVPLAPNTSVYEGIKPGDEVVLRIPFGESADGRTADRIEKQKAAAQPKSKFSQAQAPGG